MWHQIALFPPSSTTDTLCAQPRPNRPHKKHPGILSLGFIITPPKKAHLFTKAAAALDHLAKASLLSGAPLPTAAMGLLAAGFHEVPLAQRIANAGCGCLLLSYLKRL